MPSDLPFVKIEIAIPGYQPFSGTISHPAGDAAKHWELDEVAKEVHELVHNMISSIRKAE